MKKSCLKQFDSIVKRALATATFNTRLRKYGGGPDHGKEERFLLYAGFLLFPEKHVSVFSGEMHSATSNLLFTFQATEDRRRPLSHENFH